MARVTMKPELRREELLDVAFDLCRSQGFESMSVEQVTRAAGVAKGTFYHYFPSKDVMLEQLVQRFGDALFDHLSAAMTTADGTGRDRLRRLLEAAGSYKLAQSDIAYASFIYRDDNFALRHRLFGAWRERAREVLTPVIREGQTDGTLAVADVDGAADIVLLLWFEAADQLWLRALAAPDADRFAQIMVSGAASLYQAQERVLGVPEGSFAVPVSPDLIALSKQLFETLDRNL